MLEQNGGGTRLCPLRAALYRREKRFSERLVTAAGAGPPSAARLEFRGALHCA